MSTDEKHNIKPTKWEPGFFLDKYKLTLFNQMHWHNELELGIVSCGSDCTMIGHAWMPLKPGELSLFWGIVPHGLTKVISGTPVSYSLHIPMALFMEWGLPDILVDRILSQTRVLDTSQHGRSCSNLTMMRHWQALLQENDAAATEIVMLEVHTRLRYMARNLLATNHPDQTQFESDDRMVNLVGGMIKFIDKRHREPITTNDVAAAWAQLRTEQEAADQRLEAARRCQEAGYPLGFHFDPIIEYPGWEEDYRGLIEELFRHVDPRGVIWISLGTLRYPPGLERVIRERFPATEVLQGELLPAEDGKFRYLKPLRIGIYRRVVSWLREHYEDLFIYLCMEREDVWQEVFGRKPGGTAALMDLFDSKVREFFRRW